MTFTEQYIAETVDILRAVDAATVEAVARNLAARTCGGGSAAHASHAVNDFRKICGFEAYAPTDNVAELTARVNDDGWDTAISEWLKGSRLTAADALLVLSVGGGDRDRGVSVNLVQAIDLARSVGARVYGIVGRDGGYTARAADACVVIPPLMETRVTPHTEGICAVIWHLLVSHPELQVSATKWESVAQR